MTNATIVTEAGMPVTHQQPKCLAELRPSAIKVCVGNTTKIQPQELCKPVEASIEQASIKILFTNNQTNQFEKLHILQKVIPKQ